MKLQNLARSQREVEIWTLPNDTDESLHVDLLPPHVVIADPRLAIRRSHTCGEDADSRRLPGAVWSKQTKDLAALHVERQTIERNDLARRLVLALAYWPKAARGKRRRGSKDLAQFLCADTGRHVAQFYPTA